MNIDGSLCGGEMLLIQDSLPPARLHVTSATASHPVKDQTAVGSDGQQQQCRVNTYQHQM